jgi:cholesterol oxidase
MQGNDTVTPLRFTEEMKGYATFAGESTPRDLMFHLDITVPDVARFVHDPGHTAKAEGIVRCAGLGGDCLVVQGTVNLLFDVRGPAYKMMRYHLHFLTPSGEAFTLSGIKQVRDDPGCDLWSDTSTLYTSILRGHVPVQEVDSAELAASGVLYIHVRDFLTQLSSFRVDAPTFVDRSAALCRFGTCFLGSLWEVYGEKAA